MQKRRRDRAGVPLIGVVFASAALLMAGCSAVSEEVVDARVVAAPEIAFREYPQDVLWGDLHVHTNLSFDSNSLGNQRLGPEEAYRFARGETVVASSGQPAKLARPLDFLMVADHAEYLGVLSSVRNEDPALMETALGQRWSGFLSDEGGMSSVLDDYVAMVTRQKPMDLPGREHQRTIWDRLIDTAERFNRPGEFTTLAGYEWTSMPGGRNLHRVVVFRDGPDKNQADAFPFRRCKATILKTSGTT